MRKTYKNCVYKLYFEGEEDKCYIGSAKDFNNRYRNHIATLLQGIHPNRLLQLAFNKKGILAFKWEILEESIENVKKRLQKENEYIQKTKADKIGYNQTVITKSNNEHYIPEILNRDDDYIIKDFLSKYNVKIKCIRGGFFSNKWKDWSYSKYQFEQMSNMEVCHFMRRLYSYCMNYIESSHRFSIGIIPLLQARILEAIGDDKTLGKMNSFFKKAEKYTKNPIKEIVLVSALNPYHLEMAKMSKEELTKYRVASLFKILIFMNISKNITIHVPYKYYEEFKKIFYEE